MAVTPYNPQLFTDSNKSYGMGQAGPTDARSYFYDGTSFRPYLNQQEVLDYLTAPSAPTDIYRIGQFSIFIQSAAGQPVTEWWFKDNTTTLVPKAGDKATETLAGIVELATDLEMQVQASPGTEDAKVASRLKIFNWWTWVLTKIWSVTGEWIFKMIKFAAVATPGTMSGQFWFDGTNLRVYKNTADFVITKDVNSSLAGSVERVMTASGTGAVLTSYGVAEQIVTDQYIIQQCAAAIYNSGNGFTAGLVMTPGKNIYKGQICKTATHMYMSFSLNNVTRIPLG